MISYRLRGLLTCHIALLVLATPVYLYVYQLGLRHLLGGIYLSTRANVMPYLLATAVAMFVSKYFLSLRAQDYHRISWIESAQISIRQALLVALFIFSAMFILQDRAISRLIMGSFLLLLPIPLIFVNMILPRLLVRYAFQHHHHLPTLFIGSQASLIRLGEWLAAKQALGIHPVGFLSAHALAPEDVRSPYRFLGPISQLRTTIRRQAAAQVIVLDVPRDSKAIQQIVEICQETGCRLLVYNDLPNVIQHPMVSVTEEGHHFFSLQDEPLESPFNRLMKRGFDIAVSLPVVAFVLPPLTMMVWLIQRSQAPGPVFFRQKRAGHRNKDFRMIKFRSMYMNLNQANDESVQAVRHDARIFPFGFFLRRTSLDEIPQFWNVLRGEMSIVGPRPHLRQHDEQFARQQRKYRTRFFVKPGITGLAQSLGFRGEITDPKLLDQRISHDLEYISRWSIWLDMQIIVRTAWQVMFPPKSAY